MHQRMGTTNANVLRCMFFCYHNGCCITTLEACLLMCSRGSRQMAAILDQKNYLEELNGHLKYA